MALVKYNNNSLSSVTSAAGFPAGAMTLIKTLTASSSSTLSFVDGSSDVVLDSTYPIYLFKFINIHPATDAAEFQFQANASGGSGYNETITSTLFKAGLGEDDTGSGIGYESGADQAQETGFQQIIRYLGNDNDQSGSGYLRLFNPSSTTFVKHFISVTHHSHASDESEQDYVAGYFNTTSAIDEIQFKMSADEIQGGTICLYGIK